MNLGKVVFLGGAALLAYKALSAANTADNVIFDIETVRWLPPTGGKINLEVITRFKNPGQTAVTVNSIFFDVDIDGAKIGNIDRLENFKIAPQSIQKVILPFQSLHWTSLLIEGFDIVKKLISGETPNQASFEGKITGNGFTVPVSEKYNFG